MSTESRVGRFVACVASPKLVAASGCVAAGMCLWGWSRQATAVLGTGHSAWTALMLTLSFAVLLAWALRRVIERKFEAAERLSVSCSVGLVAVFAVFPSISVAVSVSGLDVLSTPSVLSSVLAQVALLTLVCSAGWLLPVTAAIFAIDRQRKSRPHHGRRDVIAFLLAGAGVVACEFLAGVAGGMDRSLLVAALFATHAMVAGVWEFARSRQGSLQPVENDEPGYGGAAFIPALESRSTTHSQVVGMVLTGLQGALCLFLLRLLDQLLLPVSWVSAVAVAAIATGIGIGTAVFRERSQTTRFGRVWRMLQRFDPVVPSLATGLLAVVLFESLVWLTLWVNAEVISVFWSTMCLAGVVTFVIGMIGFATGGLIERITGRSTDGHWTMMNWTLAFVGGLVAAAWLAPSLGQPSAAVLLTVVATSVVALAESVRTETWKVILRPQWGLALGAAVLAMCFGSPQRGATLAARLLYDTRVFVASQVEERTDTLPYLDEARCVAVAETDSGTLTIWKRRAVEFEIRRSGVPLGAVSLDTFVAPQRTGETLQAVLPLCMHPNAENVLVLGVGSGSTIETSVFFPLHEITCVESDQRHVDALSEHLFSKMPLDPLNDERVSIVTADPVIAVRSLPDTYDLVLSSAAHPAFADAVPVSSREFLSAASERLSEDGLFCQPLDIVDFGPEALGSVVHTWMSVFADVKAFEIGSGRLLLVGSQRDDEANRFDGKGFLERLQRPHVRTVLAGLGWDWSTVLKVMAYSRRDLQQAFPEGGTRPNSVVNAGFSSLLPFEVTSWGPKYQRTLATLAGVAGSVQFMTGSAGQDPDVKRRMADLEEQLDLIHEKPDHYWAYRARVKKRIKSSPQSELVQVKGEEPRHALSGVEKRRLEYFESLGEAAQQKQPTASSLNAVAEFDSPFDPLVSPFLHEEIAKLAERDSRQLGGIELWHRMHRAFFATPGDRSVRNVSRALELISEQPGLIEDPAARGDCLDALLQVLHNRWHNRGDISPNSSQIVLNDIESSLAAIDLAFNELAKLSTAREMPVDAWSARRLAVEKSLVRPLQAYRSMLLPRHAKRQRQARTADDE